MLTSMVSDASYVRLCAVAERVGHIVKLSRHGDDWGLQIVIAPAAGGEEQWRAAAVLFPDLRELDHHAGYLLAWSCADELAE
jgi:hypothetical protein